VSTRRAKKHKKSEKEYQKANPDATQSSMFLSINQTTESDAGTQSQGGVPKGNILDELKNGLKDSEATSVKDEDKLKVEENSEELLSNISRRKTALETLRCCLFCDKEFDGLKKCLDHMRLKHSFILLDVDCLVDLKGLLAYMA
jgi:hypothetical protein